MTVLLRNVSLSLQQEEDVLPGIIARTLRVPREKIRELKVVKKSLDCRRGRRPRFVFSLAFDLPAKLETKLLTRRKPLVAEYHEPRATLPGRVESRAGEKRPVVLGSGPAGLFCAHRLAQAGRPPVVIERGLEVKERSKSWYGFLKGEPFDPESNLLYGEGGAGTYSDGKLYTRISDPRNPEVLRIFVGAGAPPEILFDAHPHIGSNLLPAVVRNLRNQLKEWGTEFRFSTRLTDIHLEGGEDDLRLVGVELDPGGRLETDELFLAPGHSARDTLRLLESRGVAMEPKPFQMGVRVEHPQALVDRLQYGEAAGHPKLPPAEYYLIARRDGGDVFSFCMCPGGEILPATEKAGFICVNGASRHKRIGDFANSGFVRTIDPERFPPDGPLAGLRLQEEVESKAAALAGEPFAVPAARLVDFLEGRVSESLPDCSYPLGRTPVPFDEFLPPYLLDSLRDALRDFGRRLDGFLDPEALVVGPESRSSSPVRLLRHRHSCESVNVKGLFPMGEGAGFAGGILSAAIDGMRCAEAWLERIVLS